MANIQEMGKCPKCGSTNIDYDAIEVQDNQVYYPCTCENCGAEFEEWYNLEYSESVLT